MSRRITVEEMIADPRLPDTVFTRTPTTLLIGHGWTPIDVTALLDDWPTVAKKHARLLDTAVEVSGCHHWTDVLRPSTADLPAAITRTWVRLLTDVVLGRPVQAPAVARLIADLPSTDDPTEQTYRRQRPIGCIVSTWTRLIGDPSTAVQIVAAGITYAEAQAHQDSGRPWDTETMDSIAVLAGLRRGSQRSTR